jgi:hypothetical protein
MQKSGEVDSRIKEIKKSATIPNAPAVEKSMLKPYVSIRCSPSHGPTPWRGVGYYRKRGGKERSITDSHYDTEKYREEADGFDEVEQPACGGSERRAEEEHLFSSHAVHLCAEDKPAQYGGRFTGAHDETYCPFIAAQGFDVNRKEVEEGHAGEQEKEYGGCFKILGCIKARTFHGFRSLSE